MWKGIRNCRTYLEPNIDGMRRKITPADNFISLVYSEFLDAGTFLTDVATIHEYRSTCVKMQYLPSMDNVSKEYHRV